MSAVVSGPARWWVYQRERFPVFAHGALIASFSVSAVSFSFLLRGGSGVPAASALAVAFATAFLFFLQLRIADEFKDFDEDSRYRPYRPVPRGLVKLRELGIVGAAAAAVQLALALWLYPPLAGLLALTWTYLALMSHEFFVRDWLKARPVTYLWTHMLIIPLVDLYATACDWLAVGNGPPAGLFWFLVVSFLNGVVIEIGRKLRAPMDEEDGVETYTRLWGTRAVWVWVVMLMATALCAVVAARAIDFVLPVALVLALIIAAAIVMAWRFLATARRGAGKRFEILSGVWTLALYLSLGAVPLLVRL